MRRPLRTIRRLDPRLAALTWGRACDMRRALDTWRVAKWPSDGLTAREERLLGEAIVYLDEATDRVQRLQGSLSDRCKTAGIDRPDYSLRDR